MSAFDMHPYTKGAGKELGLHSQTLQCITGEYVTRRKQFNKVRLNWRKSGGVRRSLGWIPVNTGAAQWKNGQVYHNGHYFKVWDSYGLSQYKFRSGSFNEDARGRWYFNVVVDVEVEPIKDQDRIGIELGLTDTATCSSCGSLPESRPKGIAGLEIREWTCSGCGVTHDRDINAARNILAAGHGRLAVGIPVL
ncbi:zinc ribbon domain-containing protein [Denitrificimonas sp. JX-1]|uniref:Zinc ribbon domain-containing protein n=1 Tax=Denitrificimonas halotolerans TaxID=3098930 RepID=A0ABU5GRU9_9GAMM|nr:zinc ribbon domain-containing protein [Denitrificimonas sp. JX-1]MDY7218941.1 zinc ribbon domain-containing protein [Denitrificimonas sp. JX-1]